MILFVYRIRLEGTDLPKALVEQDESDEDIDETPEERGKSIM